MTEYEYMYHRWQVDSRLMSSSSQIMAHPSVKFFLTRPESLSFLLDQLDDNHFSGLYIILYILTGVRPYGTESIGKMGLIWLSWRKWRRDNYPTQSISVFDPFP